MNAPIPFGLCQCGCGEPTRIAPVNDRSKGWVKGRPLKYLKGHNASTLSMPGSKSHNWKGGKTLSSHGYVVLNRGATSKRKYEHIEIAERILGRNLRNFGSGNPKTEIVHHINGVKTDNSPDNLLVCTHEYHTALHHRLERSADWPEFAPVVRRGFGGACK